MFPFSRYIVAAPALSILMAGTALGDVAPVPNPVSNSIFSPANIVGGLLRGAISYGRMVADIRYGALEVDGLRGGLTLRDLQIAGVGKYERCRIDLGRMHVSGLTFWAEEESQVHIDLADLAVANNCFGPEAAMIGMITGTDSIPLEALSINVSQSSGSAALTADIEAISPGIARIEGSVDFDYVSLFSPDLIEKLAQEQSYGEYTPPTFDQDGNMIPSEDEPVGEPQFGLRGILTAGHVSVEDLGLWQRIQPLLPPDATNPQALQALVTAPPGSKLNEAQTALAAALEGFIANPGRLTAEIRPAAPVSFDSTLWTTPEDALALLPLVFTNARPTPPAALIADPAEATDARALGLALAEGRGVPQNTRRAIELLSPLSEDPEVMLVLADLLAGSDPAAGYAHALNAAAMGVPGARPRWTASRRGCPPPRCWPPKRPPMASCPRWYSTRSLRCAMPPRPMSRATAPGAAMPWHGGWPQRQRRPATTPPRRSWPGWTTASAPIPTGSRPARRRPIRQPTTGRGKTLHPGWRPRPRPPTEAQRL